MLKIAKAEHEEVQQYRAIGTVEECQNAHEDIKTLSRMYEKLNDQEVKEWHKLSEYEAIGTVEECRKAREGQIAKKPRLYGDFEDGKLLCPNCEEDLMGLEESGFDCCPYCGQKLDWSEYGW